jgi:hypothetical protein
LAIFRNQLPIKSIWIVGVYKDCDWAVNEDNSIRFTGHFMYLLNVPIFEVMIAEDGTAIKDQT